MGAYADPQIVDRRRLRIAIVTTGRFHVLDLARELSALGHDVDFYSYLPKSRASAFGLPKSCHRALLRYVAPVLVAQRVLGDRFDSAAIHVLEDWTDKVAARSLRRCDVFIGMSGLCVESAKQARARWGATVFIERGSRHILSQQEILEAIPGAHIPAISAWSVHRELWGYDFADVISVPSLHAERSFLERDVPADKLFCNPYGVDLGMFPPTPVPEASEPTALFVGAWSLQKGCDVLWQACLAANSWKLLHVGPIGDAPVPQSHLFSHHDPVPQSSLVDFYRKAHVLVQPSRQDGFGLVLSQALSCGLPLACTDRTGGEDLRAMLELDEWVTVVPHDNADALRRGIDAALSTSRKQSGIRDILGGARDRLSWKAYAKRYEEEIFARLSRRNASTVGEGSIES